MRNYSILNGKRLGHCLTNHPCPSFRKGGEKLAYLKKRGKVSLHGKEGEKSVCMVKERREYIIS